jgi:hypothetical protein
MKTILSKLSDEQAQKEVVQFSYASIVASSISIFIFWWLAMVGIFLGARGLLLTWHKGNAKDGKLALYMVLSSTGMIVGVLSWYLYSTSH